MNERPANTLLRLFVCIASIHASTSALNAQSARTNKGLDQVGYRTDSVYFRNNVAYPGYDAETKVYRERIEVQLLPTYVQMQRPKPPLKGFYGWKFSFGKNPLLTLVLRPDSALLATSDDDILRVSSLFVCKSPEQWILSCSEPVRGAKARKGNGGIIVDIKDSTLVQRLRAAKPSVLLRQTFEPGGRFRVDETGIRYFSDR